MNLELTAVAKRRIESAGGLCPLRCICGVIPAAQASLPGVGKLPYETWALLWLNIRPTILKGCACRPACATRSIG